MVVTDNFVYIHSPKSGGTFVTEMLLEAAARNSGFNAHNLTDLKHAGVRCIPEKFRHLPIVTNRRNVFSHYMSRYNYRWWTVDKHIRKTLDIDRVMADYPSFPELSFSEYLRFVNHWPYRLNIKPKLRALLEEWEIGYNTRAFVRLTQQNPTATLRTFDKIPAALLHDQYASMRFLKTESLNEDLVELLVESGISRQETSFILDHKKIIPKPAERRNISAWLGYLSNRLPRSLIAPPQQKTTDKEMRWQALYSAADIDFVLRRDRLYFTLFPEMQPVQVLSNMK